MTHKEFESVFRPMIKALDVAVNKFQAQYYFDEFKGTDYRDFKAACDFCARGKAKQLPYQNVFQDSITAAKEIRLAEIKNRHNQEAENTWAGKLPQTDPMEFLLGSVSMMNIKDRICGRSLKRAMEVEEKMRAVLADEAFQAHKFPYVMTDPAHPRPQDWLAFQLEEDPKWYAAARAGEHPIGPLQLEHVPAWED